VVLLDDGFQHLQLERNLDLVLIDSGDPWGGNRLPPLGRLREPLAALERADAVLVTKVPAEWRPAVAEIERVVDRAAPRVQVFISRMRPSRVHIPGKGWQEPAILSGQQVVAFAALGRPDGFADTLAEAGAEIVSTRWFPDHHAYTDQELSEVIAQATAASAVPVTTAKDAVKLPLDAGVWVVEVVIEPVEGSWNGLWRLLPEVRS